MASSGSFNTTGYSATDGSIYLVFSWAIQSQSIENNTTTISWTLKGGGTSAQWFQTGNMKVYLDGVSVYTQSGTIKLKSGDTVTSGTYTFSHNADGTGKFTVSVTGGIYYYTSSNASGSATFVPDTIARASQPSLVTYPDSTANVGDFGETFSIHMNTASQSFRHTVRYAYGDRTGTIATNVVNGTTWAVPLEFMNDIPNDRIGSGLIYVDTYSGSTPIGTKWTGFTATVPASVKPRCTIQVLDNTDIQDTYGNLVKGLSKLYVKTNFYAAYSSPVKAYNVTANGVKYTESEIVTGVIASDGTTTITATVTDQRSRTSEVASASFPVVDYSPPKIEALSVHRCDADGTANDRGEYVEVVFSGEVSPINNKNTAVYTVKYKKSADSTWTTLTTDVNGWKPSDLNDNYAVNNQSYVFEADGSSSYDVDVSVADNHGTASRATSASTAFTLMNFNAAGNGIGIGQVSEKENTLQVGLESEFEKDVRMVGAYAFYGAHGIYDTRDANESPEWYMTNHGRGVVWEFKKLTAIQFAEPSAKFGTLQTIIPWKDSSGGLPRQYAYEGSNCWVRFAVTATEWGAWRLNSLSSYPVGSVYIGYSHISPASLFGGTWTRIEGAFLWATDASGTIGQRGGEETHTLTIDEIPSHNHSISVANTATGTTAANNKIRYNNDASNYVGAIASNNNGGGAAHNNMPPYIQVSVWRRTA